MMAVEGERRKIYYLIFSKTFTFIRTFAMVIRMLCRVSSRNARTSDCINGLSTSIRGCKIAFFC